MKVKGYWDRLHRPIVSARLVCPAQGIDAEVPLLLDTGASRTTLLDGDAEILGLDYRRLPRSVRGTIGIGGLVETYILQDISLEIEGEPPHTIETAIKQVHVLRSYPKDERERGRIMALPSILGMDVLQAFYLHLSMRDDIMAVYA